jgi:GMP synthase-like glutamine amidotransferase
VKPVAIFRHARTEGPGHFATFLDARGIPWRMVAIDKGEPLPDRACGFAGLAFMGGPMSVNDDLPWIPPVLALIRDAVASGTPVIGHCLGGQLMSRALGGVVSRNPVKEIGWGEVKIEASPAARDWLGDLDAFVSFHWHGETFSIPPGATRIAGSQWCANQMYVLGPHLGMQCHVEMTESMIRVWTRGGWKEIRDNPLPSVQSVEAIQADIERRIPGLNSAAERLYTRWIKGLRA